MDNDIPYLLLTPGPLTTTRAVREAMLRDYSTWDIDYNRLVDEVRRWLVELASPDSSDATSVLMQGSGTFAVEATLGCALPEQGKLLIISNGAYGRRMRQIAQRLKIRHALLEYAETEPPLAADLDQQLSQDPEITHVAVVHCETTTGILNPIQELGKIARTFQKILIVDAMSSLGGIPLSLEQTGASFSISSANKCIQGVPGFGFVVATRQAMAATRGQARSLCLDLYDQWREMEENGGKWRYTSPTHTVCAFHQALRELQEEGGVAARHARYRENQRRLVAGMRKLGFRTLLPDALQSPIITAFHFPQDPRFSFDGFYDRLKKRRFVIYPGKVTNADTFRIGTIGNVCPADIEQLLREIQSVGAELGWLG